MAFDLPPLGSSFKSGHWSLPALSFRKDAWEQEGKFLWSSDTRPLFCLVQRNERMRMKRTWGKGKEESWSGFLQITPAEAVWRTRPEVDCDTLSDLNSCLPFFYLPDSSLGCLLMLLASNELFCNVKLLIVCKTVSFKDLMGTAQMLWMIPSLDVFIPITEICTSSTKLVSVQDRNKKRINYVPCFRVSILI